MLRLRAIASVGWLLLALLGAPATVQAQGFDFDELDIGEEDDTGGEAEPAPEPTPPPADDDAGMDFGSDEDSGFDFDGLDIGGEEEPAAEPAPTQPPPQQRPPRQQPPPRQQQPPSYAPQPQPAPAPQPEVRQRDSFSLPGTTVTTQGYERTRFEQGVSLYKSGEFDQASVAFFNILNDPALKSFHPSAQYFLARCLYKLELYHLSLHFLNQILEQGTSHKFFKASLGWLVFIAHKVADESVVLDTISRFPNIEFPRRYKDEFNFLLAKYHAQQDDPGRARELAAKVSAESEFYPRARYLLAVLDYEGQRYQDAVNNLKTVIERQAARVADDDEPEDVLLLEMGYTTMARLHYEAQRFNHAKYYYDKISRGSELWLTSLMEAAWATFREGRDEKALGNLLTVNAPMFADAYHPESLILKAVIYFENCRYPEARQILEEFLGYFTPLHEELKRITSQGWQPSQYYGLLSDIQDRRAADSSPQLERILQVALTDKTLRRLNSTIREIEGESARLQSQKDFWRVSPMARAAADILKANKQFLVTQAGTLAQSKLLLERDRLNSLIGQTYRIQYETATAEKEALGMTLRQDKGRVRLREYAQSVAVADDEVYWPFEGEYWADELGTYEYTLTKGCK